MIAVKAMTAIVLCLSLALLGLGGQAAAQCITFGCDQQGTHKYWGMRLENHGEGNGIVGVNNSTSYDMAGVAGYGNNLGPGVLGVGTLGSGVIGKASNLNYGGVLGTNTCDPGMLPWWKAWGVKGQADKATGVMGLGVVGVYGGGNCGIYGATSAGATNPAVIGDASANTGSAGMGVKGLSKSTDTNTPAVMGDHTGGSGIGVLGAANTGIGVKGASNTGEAGHFEITNVSNTSFALTGQHAGGIGVYGLGKNTGVYGTASADVGYGVQGTSVSGSGGYFRNTGDTATKSALKAQTAGTGWAGEFRGTGLASRGVYVKTAGGQALLVEGGVKSAVVDTSQGKRTLYAEEASEVYFTDYGFGKLKDGKAVIAIDPLFAETVNVQEPYHVFIQARGNADLYVGKCTSKGFEVCLRGGEDNVEFSYRLVAKRQGFETARLEAAPCPDDGPGMSPERQGEKVAALAIP